MCLIPYDAVDRSFMITVLILIRHYPQKVVVLYWLQTWYNSKLNVYVASAWWMKTNSVKCHLNCSCDPETCVLGMQKYNFLSPDTLIPQLEVPADTEDRSNSSALSFPILGSVYLAVDNITIYCMTLKAHKSEEAYCRYILSSIFQVMWKLGFLLHKNWLWDPKWQFWFSLDLMLYIFMF